MTNRHGRWISLPRPLPPGIPHAERKVEVAAKTKAGKVEVAALQEELREVAALREELRVRAFKEEELQLQLSQGLPALEALTFRAMKAEDELALSEQSAEAAEQRARAAEQKEQAWQRSAEAAEQKCREILGAQEEMQLLITQSVGMMRSRAECSIAEQRSRAEKAEKKCQQYLEECQWWRSNGDLPPSQEGCIDAVAFKDVEADEVQWKHQWEALAVHAQWEAQAAVEFI